MKKKFTLTNETKKFLGKNIYRIQAVKDFSDVKKGDLGGWIEKEENLSHDGNCWLYNEAIVCDNAKVCNNAKIMCSAIISNNAVVKDNAQVDDYALVRDNAIVCGNTILIDDVVVCNNAIVNSDIQFQSSLLIYTDKNGKLQCETSY